jgi:hypothetical protein
VEDMIDILLDLHKYVPLAPLENTDETSNLTITADQLHHILFGGDQLTRKCAETAKEARTGAFGTRDYVCVLLSAHCVVHEHWTH